MGCGPGVGGALMDDLIYPRLWLVEDDNDKKRTDHEDSDHDIRKLFPKRDGKNKKTAVKKISTKGTPEWLAMSVGVFFIGALFTIASYQVYSASVSDQISNVEIHNDEDDVLADAVKPAADDDNIKLPTHILPVSYKLYLNVSVLNKKYNGIITIEIKCVNETDKIILHSVRHNINISKIKLKTDDKVHKPLNVRRSKERLVLSFNESLIPGSTYHLLLGFHNDLDDEVTHGIYLTEYTDGNGKKRKMVSYDLEPTRARYVFPCFDEPSLRAPWKIILHPEEKDYHALSNMPEEKTVRLDDGTKEIFFKTTPPMSSYLVSFAFTEYAYREKNSSRGIPVRVYAPIGRLNETIKPLKYALFAVDYFSDHFGVSYALPKLDLFPVTKFSASADESWGNIIFSESSLLLNPESSSQYNYKYVCGTIAHEISHQWFGDLVSIKWWNDLWLKEAFATYVQNLPVALQEHDWDMESAAFDNAISAFPYDSSKYTHSIATNELDPKKLENSYDVITYEKGASVLSMLARYLGNKKFFHGLQIYLKRFQFKSASVTDLWEALSESEAAENANETVDVVGMMKTWVNYPGFPVITVKLDGNKLMFEQEKFAFKNGVEEESSSKIWHVPINIKICGKVLQNVLTTKKGEMTLPSNCDLSKEYKVNFGTSGYFHVKYADDNWQRLLSLLNDDHLLLPTIDRAGLLYDVLALVSYNHLDIAVALNFTKYLDNELDPQAWISGLGLLGRIRHVFYNTELKKLVEDYTNSKMAPVLGYLSSLQHHNHKHIQLMQTLMDHAVVYEMKILPAEMENRFLRWIVQNGTANLPINTRYQILHAGIRNGNEAVFNYVNSTRMKSKSTQEHTALTRALAYTRDPKLLKRIVDEGVSKLDLRTLQYVCSNRYGRHMAFEAVKKHWKAIAKKFEVSSGMVHYVLSACLSQGTTAADKDEAEKFLNNTDLSRWKVYVQRSIEKIEHNIAFAARYEKDIKLWFYKYASSEYEKEEAVEIVI